jgi:hypothetical protein
MIRQSFDCKQCVRWNAETQCCQPIKAGFRVIETKNDCLNCKFYQKQASLNFEIGAIKHAKEKETTVNRTRTVEN